MTLKTELLLLDIVTFLVVTVPAFALLYVIRG